MFKKKRRKSPVPEESGAGLGRYLKAAFLFRWNLLLFLGGTAAALLSPWTGVLLPLVAAGELSYLAGLVSIPRFRAAIDARAHQEDKTRATKRGAEATASQSLEQMLERLPATSRRRFEELHARCLEMRSIARGVTGRTGDPGHSGDEIRTPALNRLLWVFLRLLLSQDALNRFLATTDENEIRSQLASLRKQMTESEQGGDERIARSLQDSIAVHELRLENYRKAEGNAGFVAIELDRLEVKIQALTEMAVNRQDPDRLSSQVDSVAESMRQTEKALTELQHITGLTEELEEPPAILESNLRGVVRDEA
jgi:hypothetical protein